MYDVTVHTSCEHMFAQVHSTVSIHLSGRDLQKEGQLRSQFGQLVMFNELEGTSFPGITHMLWLWVVFTSENLSHGK